MITKTDSMRRRIAVFPRVVFSLLLAPSVLTVARAEGLFIAAPNRVDIAYDDARHVLYISSGTDLIRYDLSTNTLLPALTLGGSLSGMDISADGKFLAVADTSFAGGEFAIHIVDLAAQTHHDVKFVEDSGEGGSFTVAYGSDGSLLISSTFQGSGYAPLRRYYPVTDSTLKLSNIQQNTMLRANADRTVIALAESNSSGGPFDTYAINTGTFLRTGSSGTGWFNYEVGISPDAQQILIPTYNGTYVANSTLVLSPNRVGQYAAGQPVGVAYNPVNNAVYFPWAGTTHVFAYDRTTLTQIADYNFNSSSSFGSNGNYAFVNGRVKTSNDGSLLFVTVAGGVRYITLNPRPPANLHATAGNQAIQLQWDSVPNATAYRVYMGVTAGAEATTPIVAGLSGNSTTISNLTNGTQYFFTVAADTAAGTSTPSDEVSAAPKAVPLVATGFTATPNDGKVFLAWNAISNAASYTVYQGTSSGNEVAIASGVATTAFVASNLTNGVPYYFQVAGVNSSGVGLRSTELSATPVGPPVAVTGLTVTPNDAIVTLGWNAVPNAATYTVFASTVAGAEVVIASGLTSTSATVPNLVNGTTYYFQVAAVNVTATGPRSAEASATPMPVPVVVNGVAVAPNDARANLTWNAVPNATSYTVYQGTASGNEVVVASGVTPTSFVAMNLANGVGYYFQVAASNASGIGPRSTEVSATPVAVPTTPTGLTAAAGNQTITLSWNAVAGATNYDVFQSTTAGGFAGSAPVTSTTTTSITVSGLTNDTTYYLGISARNGSGSSAAASASARPSAPPQDTKSGGGGFELGWVLALAAIEFWKLLVLAPSRRFQKRHSKIR